MFYPLMYIIFDKKLNEVNFFTLSIRCFIALYPLCVTIISCFIYVHRFSRCHCLL